MKSWFDALEGGTRGRLLELLRRSPRSVPELAAAVSLSDNAVRTHLAALQRDGMVEPAGVRRETGGKPAQLYDLSRAAEELFPKAYAAVLAEVLGEIERRDGRVGLEAVLRGVAERTAAGPAEGDLAARVMAAAAVLRSLGGDLDVEREAEGWRLRGYGCPLSTVVEDHHGACELVRSLVERTVDAPVAECCDRTGRPRCGFRIQGDDAGAAPPAPDSG